VITAVAFAGAAIAGALARAEAGRRWNRTNGFAVGTLVVNVTGSFLLGLLAHAAPLTVTVLAVGGLGAYTTFSSFARDAVALAELRHVGTAAAYVGATCVLGLAAASAGVAIANL
jgi:fluoride exporter